MNAFALASIIFGFAGAGQHETKPEEAMSNLTFLVGDWKGKQTFITANGDNLVGEATDHAEWAVGGRFIEEHLSTTLTNRGPSDARHMLGYDKKTEQYVAYWFNDTSSLPTVLTGKLAGSKLVLQTSSVAPGSTQRTTMRFTYDGSTSGELSLTFEMETAGTWQLLFKTVYSK